MVIHLNSSSNAPLSSDTFKLLLSKVVKTPEYFGPSDLKLALRHLFSPDLLDPSQIGAFLTALHINRLERRPESLIAAAQVLREHALKANVLHAQEDFVVDIVGTGGDGYNLFNVSTTAAVVAAGAGARVIKHGSTASTSSSGSADLLKALDCPFTAPSPDNTEPTPIGRAPFHFILAPHYHPALARIAPYRKALPFRTMFNILGPLINPASPKGMVLGVAEPSLGYPFAMSLRDAGVQRAMVVCGFERLDEISCAGPTYVWELDQDGKIEETAVSPLEDFGIQERPLSSVAGGSPQENAETFKRLLTSGRQIPEELKPVCDFVLLNTSALLVVAGLAKDFKHGTELALESIVSGKAWEALSSFRESNKILAEEAAML